MRDSSRFNEYITEVPQAVAAPLERVKMEMQIKRNSDALAVARKIVSEGGVTAFWQGNLMNLIRVTPHKVISIMIHCITFNRGQQTLDAESFSPLSIAK